MGDLTTHPILSMSLTHTMSGQPVQEYAKILLYECQLLFEEYLQEKIHLPRNRQNVF